MFYRIRGNTGDFTFYIFMRAKETVDGNRDVEDGREGEIKGTFLGEKEKKGKGEEARTGGGRKGKGDNVEGKDAERRKK